MSLMAFFNYNSAQFGEGGDSPWQYWHMGIIEERERVVEVDK